MKAITREMSVAALPIVATRDRSQNWTALACIASISSIEALRHSRFDIPGPPTLPGGPPLLLAEPLRHNHRHSHSVKCNAWGAQILSRRHGLRYAGDRDDESITSAV